MSSDGKEGDGSVLEVCFVCYGGLREGRGYDGGFVEAKDRVAVASLFGGCDVHGGTLPMLHDE